MKEVTFKLPSKILKLKRAKYLSILNRRNSEDVMESAQLPPVENKHPSER